MRYYMDVLKKYAVFSGRARRKEFWMFYLFNALISLVLLLIALVAGNAGTALSGLYGLAVLVPGLAVTWRRLHDTDRSGWWLLIDLVPYACAIILIVFLALDGTRGPTVSGRIQRGLLAAIRLQLPWVRAMDVVPKCRPAGIRTLPADTSSAIGTAMIGQALCLTPTGLQKTSWGDGRNPSTAAILSGRAAPRWGRGS